MLMTPLPSPAISVAMSVYNGERFLAEAIESVLAQTCTDFEFMILDDGSTDSSRDIITTYASFDSRIRPIFRKNRGLIASLNQLLSEARAPLIARMDADDICLPERFALQMAFLDANPDFGVVGALADDICEDGNPWPGQQRPLPTTEADIRIALENGDPFLCHPAVMYRRKLVLGVGAYHAAFRHCEDLDLWLRLASVTRLANLDQTLLRYRHYEAQVSNRHATAQHTGAAIARLAYQERLAGRPDPTEHLCELPAIDSLDALFDRPGLAGEVRATVARGLTHSRHAMRDEGFDLLVRHLREGGEHDGMWRTVARLLRFGEPVRAARLATTLVTS